MELNITLGIQILNFLLAWSLLHIFLFKPAIQHMQMQQQAYDKLLEAVSVWQGRIVQKEQEISLIWNELSAFVQHHKPDIEHIPQEYVRYAYPHITLQHQEHAVLVQTLKDVLVTGLTDVDI